MRRRKERGHGAVGGVYLGNGMNIPVEQWPSALIGQMCGYHSNALIAIIPSSYCS